MKQTGEERLIGSYRNGFELALDSVKQKDQNTLEFKGIFGEGSFYGEELYNLDLKSGEITQLSKIEKDGTDSSGEEKLSGLQFQVIKTIPLPGGEDTKIHNDPKRDEEFIIAVLRSSSEDGIKISPQDVTYYFFKTEYGALYSLGSWNGDYVASDLSSFKYMPSERQVQFESGYGDAGCFTHSVWSIDLLGSGVKNVSTKSGCEN